MGRSIVPECVLYDSEEFGVISDHRRSVFECSQYVTAYFAVAAPPETRNVAV
jgi:hypothetical protein